MPIQDFLTPDLPLGPDRHEFVFQRIDPGQPYGDPVNLLLCKTAPVDRALMGLRSIILGRRGSGKTAVIAAMMALSDHKHYYHVEDDHPTKNRDLYVLIQSFDHLDKLEVLVSQDCSVALGSHSTWEDLHVETVARFWERHLWQAVFNQIYREGTSSYKSSRKVVDYKQELPLVFKFIEGQDIHPHDLIEAKNLEAAFQKTKDSILHYLKANRRRCMIIIDSLDEYPIVTGRRFPRLLAGFLRCIANFNGLYTNAKIYCCIPEEIEPFIHHHAANQGRDLSPNTSFTRLRWTAHDILKVIASRYREFLKIALPSGAAKTIAFWAT